jgi:16S rRNA (cytidine1402-2'-O)-methyltransferase
MTLYVVSTPIGNLADISFRALDVLKTVDYVLAEDTRQSSKLLTHYKFQTKLISFNDQNKEKRTPHVIDDLKNQKRIALISDSGTPGVSDPGFYLVREAVKNELKIVPVPGATAFVSALVSSGLATDRFTFYGFLPKKEGKRNSVLELVKQRNETAVFYESPYRLEKDLIAINKILPGNQVVVARELTKKFEEFIRGTASEILEKIESKKIKGEIVLLIGKL